MALYENRACYGRRTLAGVVAIGDRTMTRRLIDVSRVYGAALRRYVTAPSRHLLHEALPIGRQVVALGFENILRRPLGAVTTGPASRARTSRAEAVFEEAAEKMMERQSAVGSVPPQLIRLKKMLAGRTAELAESTIKLQCAIKRRLIAEESLRTSTHHFRSLMRNSERKSKKLRHLAHQSLAAHEHKRHTLSHDLQDDVAQTLLGIQVQLILLRTKWGIDQQGITQNIALTLQLVAQSSKSVRMVMRKIRTP